MDAQQHLDDLGIGMTTDEIAERQRQSAERWEKTADEIVERDIDLEYRRACSECCNAERGYLDARNAAAKAETAQLLAQDRYAMAKSRAERVRIQLSEAKARRKNPPTSEDA